MGRRDRAGPGPGDGGAGRAARCANADGRLSRRRRAAGRRRARGRRLPAGIAGQRLRRREERRRPLPLREQPRRSALRTRTRARDPQGQRHRDVRRAGDRCRDECHVEHSDRRHRVRRRSGQGGIRRQLRATRRQPHRARHAGRRPVAQAVRAAEADRAAGDATRGPVEPRQSGQPVRASARSGKQRLPQESRSILWTRATPRRWSARMSR